MYRWLVPVLIVAALAGSAVAQSRPREAVNRNNFGTELLKQGKLGEALNEFRRAVELDPGFPEAQANLAFTLLRLNQADEAIVAHEKAIAVDPRNGTLHNNLGVLRNRQGQYDEAVKSFEEALRLNPSDPAAAKNLETARGNQKARQEKQERIAEARRGAEARPNDPRAAYALARVLAWYRQDDEALEWLEKAAALRYPDRAAWRDDPAFGSLKAHRRFTELVEGR
jgi:Tfp pilus assembly protein PilF